MKMQVQISVLLLFTFVSSIKGCPNNATPIPGNAKQYIEVVHGVVHERQCARGTEFNVYTCDCSVFTGDSLSAMMGGLTSSHPDLANVPLDTLQKELLHLNSLNSRPIEIQQIQPIYQPEILPNLQIPPFHEPSVLHTPYNNENIMELIQTVRLEDVPTDVLIALDRMMHGGSNPVDKMIMQTQTQSVPSVHNIQPAMGFNQDLAHDNLFRDPVVQKKFENFNQHRNTNTRTNNLLRQIPNEHVVQNHNDLQSAIASFRNIISFPEQNVNSQPKQLLKQSALDNFQSIASSLLKRGPEINQGFFNQNEQNKQPKPNDPFLPSPRQQFSLEQSNNRDQTRSWKRPLQHDLPMSTQQQQNQLQHHVSPPPFQAQQQQNNMQTLNLNLNTVIAKTEQTSPLKYFGPALKGIPFSYEPKKSPITSRNQKEKPTTFQLSQTSTTTQPTPVTPTQSTKIPVQKQQHTSTTEGEQDPDTNKETTEVSATKLLKEIKRQLKEAKKTGNIPFSLLKVLLQKRKVLIKKLKEERAAKKAKKEQMKIDEQNKQMASKTEQKQNVEDDSSIKKPITSPHATPEQNAANSNNEKINENKQSIVTSERTNEQGSNAKKPKETDNAIGMTRVDTTKNTNDKKKESTFTIKTTSPSPSPPQTPQPTTTTTTKEPTTTYTEAIASTQTVPKDTTLYESSTSMSTDAMVTPDTPTHTNEISSFSSGQPWSSGTETKASQTTKRRKSKPAEFQYKPKEKPKESKASILFSLLADSPLMQYFPNAAPQTNQPPNTNQRPQQEIPRNEPLQNSAFQNDLFGAHTNLMASKKEKTAFPSDLFGAPTNLITSSKQKPTESKLKSPLLSQDLAMITAFLKERREMRNAAAATIAPKAIPIDTAYLLDQGTKEFASSLSMFDRNYPALTHSIETYQPPIQTVEPKIIPQEPVRMPNPTQAPAPTENSATQPKPSGVAGLDASKRAILSKVMERLAALEKNNQAPSPSNGQTQAQSAMTSGNNNGGSWRQNSNSNGAQNFNNNQQNYLLQKSRSSMMSRGKNQATPYNMMFNGIAAKEGHSDAQEIMQDQITEMDPASALAIGAPPISVMNPEIASQLSSTMFDNGPMPFLMK